MSNFHLLTKTIRLNTTYAPNDIVFVIVIAVICHSNLSGSLSELLSTSVELGGGLNCWETTSPLHARGRPR